MCSEYTSGATMKDDTNNCEQLEVRGVTIKLILQHKSTVLLQLQEMSY